MAFMMPVMKNEFDIYKNRSRKVSECSNGSCRSRKVSECRSEGPTLSQSPGDYVASPAHRGHSMPINRVNSRPFSRTSSRTSQSSLTSPTKTSTGCSPPKPSGGSQSSLNKFHIRLVDKLRKSLRKSRSEDRSWGEDYSTRSTTPSRTPHKLSHSSNSATPILLEDDSGLGNSDSVLHLGSSKPPLPPNSTVSTISGGRIRSRSIGTASVTTPVRRPGRWSRFISEQP